MVSIIILSYNKWPVTQACLSSIYASVTVPFEVILVDNGSIDETLTEIRKFPEVNLLANGSNRGFPAGCNQGLRAAKGEYVWFLNNDTLVPKSSLEIMLEVLRSDPTIGMVGPMTNNISGVQCVKVEYGQPYKDVSLDEVNRQMDCHKANNSGIWRVLRLVGFSLLMKRDLAISIGGFDETYGNGMFEDDDIGMKLLSRGYSLVIARQAFIHHIGKVTSSEIISHDDMNWFRNQRHACCSWGVSIPSDTRQDNSLNRLLGKYDLYNKKVVHIACSAGSTGLYLKQAFSCEVTGIEATDRAHQFAGFFYDHYFNFSYKELYAQGGHASLPFPSEYFDFVIIEKIQDNTEFASVWKLIRPYVRKESNIVVYFPLIVSGKDSIETPWRENYVEWWGEGQERLWLKRFYTNQLPEGLVVCSTDERVCYGYPAVRNAWRRYLSRYSEREGEYDFFHEMELVAKYD